MQITAMMMELMLETNIADKNVLDMGWFRHSCNTWFKTWLHPATGIITTNCVLNSIENLKTIK